VSGERVEAATDTARKSAGEGTGMARLVFMGSPDFALPALRRLVADGHEVLAVYTRPDREAGRGRELTPPPVKQLARELGLPVFQPPSLRREAAVAELRALRPEVIVVAAYGQILPRPVLDIPPRGILNIHASLLPRWRGAAPVQAAILAGDAETGVSIMLIDEGLDTGPVLARRATAISDFDTAGTLTERLAGMGAELLSETLPAWLAGAIVPVPQDESRATSAPRIEKAQGRLDWTRPAVELWRRVRAYTPWPGAFTTLHGDLLRLHEAWPLAGESDEPAGTVVALPPGALDAVPAERPRPAFAVQTGEGLLLPLKLQRAGRRVLYAEEFLRGERSMIGSRLGAG
jgi:methionyl-tRNA formyltransferase